MSHEDSSALTELAERLTRREFGVQMAGASLATSLPVAGSAWATAPISFDEGRSGNFGRGYLYRHHDIRVEPDVVVDMFADWGNNEKYLPSWFPLKISNEILPGSEEGRFPCRRRTRVFFPAPPGGIAPPPGDYIETLMSVDIASRTLIYTVDGIGPKGSRNFICSVEVDELGNGRSRFAFRTRFDLPAGESVDAYVKRMEEEYTLFAEGFEETASAFINNRRPTFMKYRDSLNQFL